MVKIIEDGYLILTDGSNILELACERISVDYLMKPEFKNYEGGTNIGWHLGKEWLEFKAEGIILNSHTKFSNCIDYIKTWTAAGTFTLKVERDTTPNYVEWDGDNTTFTVLPKDGLKQMEALSITQFSDIWVIGNIVFKEAGSRSA